MRHAACRSARAWSAILAAAVWTAPGAARAQATAPPCGEEADIYLYLRERMLNVFAGSSPEAQAFRASNGLRAVPADSVAAVADPATCRRALAALDAWRRSRNPAYVSAMSPAERGVYVLRAGDQLAAIDPDVRASEPGSSAGNVLVIFSAEFARPLTFVW